VHSHWRSNVGEGEDLFKAHLGNFKEIGGEHEKGQGSSLNGKKGAADDHDIAKGELLPLKKMTRKKANEELDSG